jgi:Zn-finger protein
MTIWSTAEASDSARRLAEYLEGLKNAKADREGTHFPFVISSLWSFLLVPWYSLYCSADYTTGGNARSADKGKTTWSAVDRSLAEEKNAHHAVEQALQNSNDAKSELTQELESTKAFLTATHDKLTNKLAALDVAMIWEQQAKIQMKIAEEKLKAAEEKLKTQEQSLDLTRQALSKIILRQWPTLWRYLRTTCRILMWRFFARTSPLTTRRGKH